MWWIHLAEGYALDACVRAAQFALAMGRAAPVEIHVGQPEPVHAERKPEARWRGLLAPHERVFLREQSPTLEQKEEGLAALMSSVARVLRAGDDAPVDLPEVTISVFCRPGHVVQPCHTPNSWLFLTSYDETQPVRHLEGYERVFVIAPLARGPLPPEVTALPGGVDTDVFKPRGTGESGTAGNGVGTVNAAIVPAEQTDSGLHVLLVGQGDKASALDMARSLLDAGAASITLFDPYLPRLTDLPARVSHVDMRPPEGRAQAFVRCNASLVADPSPFIDNHFLWEAAACGAAPLVCHVSGQAQAWNDATLRAAMAAAQSGAPPVRQVHLVPWSTVATWVRNTPPPAPALPVAKVDDASVPTMLLCHGGGRSRLVKPRHLGISVATHLIIDGFEAAAPGRLNFRWLDYQDADSTRGRFYLYPEGEVEGRAETDLDYGTLPAAIARGNLDVLCSCDPVVDDLLAARQLWATRALPVIAMLHSAHGHGLTFHWLLHVLQYEIYPFDAVISPSHCGAAVFREIFGSARQWLQAHTRVPSPAQPRVEVIPYGIERAPFAGLHRPACRHALGLPHDEVLLLSVSRFSRREKADMLPLLLAVQALHTQGRRVSLLMAGGASSKPYLQSLRDTIAALGLTDVVRIFENADPEQKKMLLGAADVFVSVSDNVQETYGLAIVEAMAARLPVVASAWNGAREIVREGETGFLVPTLWQPPDVLADLINRLGSGVMGYGNRDLHESVVVDIPMLTKRLATLIENADLRLRMGRRAFDVCVQDYDLRTQGVRMAELSHALVAMAAKHPWDPKRDRGPFLNLTAQRFAGYPEGAVDDAQVLEVSPIGADRNMRYNILRAGWDQASPQEVALAQRVLSLATQKPGSTVWELSSQLSREAMMSQDMARLRVVRCWKYGLLQRPQGVTA